MKIRLYNTLTREVEDFVPLEEGRVGLYTCGPTVYNRVHIGNLRAFLTYDATDLGNLLSRRKAEFRRVTSSVGRALVERLDHKLLSARLRHRKQFPSVFFRPQASLDNRFGADCTPTQQASPGLLATSRLSQWP